MRPLPGGVVAVSPTLTSTTVDSAAYSAAPPLEIHYAECSGDLSEQPFHPSVPPFAPAPTTIANPQVQEKQMLKGTTPMAPESAQLYQIDVAARALGNTRAQLTSLTQLQHHLAQQHTAAIDGRAQGVAQLANSRAEIQAQYASVGQLQQMQRYQHAAAIEAHSQTVEMAALARTQTIAKLTQLETEQKQRSTEAGLNETAGEACESPEWSKQSQLLRLQTQQHTLAVECEARLVARFTESDQMIEDQLSFLGRVEYLLQQQQSAAMQVYEQTIRQALQSRKQTQAELDALVHLHDIQQQQHMAALELHAYLLLQASGQEVSQSEGAASTVPLAGPAGSKKRKEAPRLDDDDAVAAVKTKPTLLGRQSRPAAVSDHPSPPHLRPLASSSSPPRAKVMKVQAD